MLTIKALSQDILFSQVFYPSHCSSDLFMCFGGNVLNFLILATILDTGAEADSTDVHYHI